MNQLTQRLLNLIESDKAEENIIEEIKAIFRESRDASFAEKLELHCQFNYKNLKGEVGFAEVALLEGKKKVLEFLLNWNMHRLARLLAYAKTEKMFNDLVDVMPWNDETQKIVTYFIEEKIRSWDNRNSFMLSRLFMNGLDPEKSYSIHDDSKPISDCYRVYESVKLSFECAVCLKYAKASFSKNINESIQRFLNAVKWGGVDFVISYLENILIKSESIEELKFISAMKPTLESDIFKNLKNRVAQILATVETRCTELEKINNTKKIFELIQKRGNFQEIETIVEAGNILPDYKLYLTVQYDKQKENMNLLEAAVYFGRPDVVELLLSKQKIDVGSEGTLLRMVTLSKAADDIKLKMAAVVFRNGVKIDDVDPIWRGSIRWGYYNFHRQVYPATALHIACNESEVSGNFLRYLLLNGANLMAPFFNGHSNRLAIKITDEPTKKTLLEIATSLQQAAHVFSAKQALNATAIFPVLEALRKDMNFTVEYLQGMAVNNQSFVDKLVEALNVCIPQKSPALQAKFKALTTRPGLQSAAASSAASAVATAEAVTTVAIPIFTLPAEVKENKEKTQKSDVPSEGFSENLQRAKNLFRTDPNVANDALLKMAQADASYLIKYMQDIAKDSANIDDLEFVLAMKSVLEKVVAFNEGTNPDVVNAIYADLEKRQVTWRQIDNVRSLFILIQEDLSSKSTENSFLKIKSIFESEKVFNVNFKVNFIIDKSVERLSLLEAAVYFNREDVVRFLLEQGVKIENGEALLRLAALINNVKMGALLLEKGVKGNEGSNRPVHIACRKGRAHYLHFLLANGASPPIKIENRTQILQLEIAETDTAKVLLRAAGYLHWAMNALKDSSFGSETVRLIDAVNVHMSFTFDYLEAKIEGNLEFVEAAVNALHVNIQEKSSALKDRLSALGTRVNAKKFERDNSVTVFPVTTQMEVKDKSVVVFPSTQVENALIAPEREKACVSGMKRDSLSFVKIEIEQATTAKALLDILNKYASILDMPNGFFFAKLGITPTNGRDLRTAASQKLENLFRSGDITVNEKNQKELVTLNEQLDLPRDIKQKILATVTQQGAAASAVATPTPTVTQGAPTSPKSLTPV